jgi:cystathionine beta-synthase
VSQVVQTLKDHDISQVPVVAEGKCIGIASESMILSHILPDPRRVFDPVETVVSKKVLIVDRDTPLARVSDAMLSGDVVLVRCGDAPDPERLCGIVTKIDLIDYFAKV